MGEMIEILLYSSTKKSAALSLWDRGESADFSVAFKERGRI